MVHSPDELAELRSLHADLASSLPKRVDAAAIGVASKAPFKMLCLRESLAWRMEELTRGVIECLLRNDEVAAAILARACLENSALLWSLSALLTSASREDAEKLDAKLMRMLMGSKRHDELPSPIHIHDHLRAIEKDVPNFVSAYDALSEVAHPNWSGVAGHFSKPDPATYVTSFGRGLREGLNTAQMSTNVATGALFAFNYAFNQISKELPAFIAKLEKL